MTYKVGDKLYYAATFLHYNPRILEYTITRIMGEIIFITDDEDDESAKSTTEHYISTIKNLYGKTQMEAIMIRIRDVTCEIGKGTRELEILYEMRKLLDN